MKVLSIVLPTFNEKANLQNFVEKVLSEQKQLPEYQFELIIADSNSTDGTIAVAKKLAQQNKHIHFLSVGPGLGVALHDGHMYAIKHLHPDILMQLDADGQVEVSIIHGLVKIIEEGYTLALGSRFITGGKNELSLSRRFFSKGSSYVCRLLMGPWDIKEFTNSSRAFTPQLFQKINWNKLPWQQQTFILQPAFLHGAILAGATYKEVPLVFKNRAKGYSKNKTVSYLIDVISYALDVRLQQWHIPLPLFALVQKIK